MSGFLPFVLLPVFLHGAAGRMLETIPNVRCEVINHISPTPTCDAKTIRPIRRMKPTVSFFHSLAKFGFINESPSQKGLRTAHYSTQKEDARSLEMIRLPYQSKQVARGEREGERGPSIIGSTNKAKGGRKDAKEHKLKGRIHRTNS